MQKPTTLHPKIAIQQCIVLRINVLQIIYVLMYFASSLWKYTKYEQMCLWKHPKFGIKVKDSLLLKSLNINPHTNTTPSLYDCLWRKFGYN